MRKMNKIGFSLAEVLIALTILGIVAMLVVPGLTNKSQTMAKRVKIKKALSVYESAINTIITENNLPQTTSSLDSFIKNDDECSNAYKYFKAIEKNGCQFKTSDGLWWDVGTNATVSKPIIAFKKSDLTIANAIADRVYKAFYFQTEFDNNSSPRVMDISYGWNNPVPSLILNYSKVSRFLGNDEIMKFCNSNVNTNCIRKTSGGSDCITTYTSGQKAYGCYFEVIGSNGKKIFTRQGCDPNGNCSVSYRASVPTNIPVGTVSGYYDEEYNNCDSQADNCTSKSYSKYSYKASEVNSLAPENSAFGTREGVSFKHSGCAVNDTDLSTCTNNTIGFSYITNPAPNPSKNGMWIRVAFSSNNGGKSYEVKEYDHKGNSITSKGCDITGQNCTGATAVSQKISSSTTLQFSGCNSSGHNCTSCKPANYCPSNVAEYTSEANFKLFDRE